MLSSISPFGERARRQRYWVTVSAFVVAAGLAGATLGMALGWFGAPFVGSVPWPWSIASLAVIGVAMDLRLLGFAVPGPRRQVNEDWLSAYRGWVYGAGFGAQLGSGFATIVSASALWVTFACALLSGSAARGAVIGALFGTMRALPLLANSTTRDPISLREKLRARDRLRSVVTRTSLVAQTVLAAGVMLFMVVRS